MNITIDRLKIIFLGIFAVAVVAIWGYQIFYVWPAKACERDQRWWDGSTRTCATPIFIPDITGRPAGVSREDWSKQQAAKAQQRERMGPNAQGSIPKVEAPKPAEASSPAEKPAAK